MLWHGSWKRSKDQWDHDSHILFVGHWFVKGQSRSKLRARLITVERELFTVYSGGPSRPGPAYQTLIFVEGSFSSVVLADQMSLHEKDPQHRAAWTGDGRRRNKANPTAHGGPAASEKDSLAKSK